MNINIPKVQMALSLIVIAISAVLYFGKIEGAFSILLAVAAVLVSDAIFIRIRNIEPFYLNAAIVSGLIIGLLSFPTLPWYNVVLAGVAAMAVKNFLRFKSKHIFNPAASGLFVAGILFHHNISWWGVSIFSLVIFLPGLVSMVRLRRYRILIGFFLVYLLAGTLIFHSVLVLILDSATIFFSLVMLPEPMTTPNKPIRQLLFGVLVGVISLIPISFLPDQLLTGLLLGNLIFFV